MPFKKDNKIRTYEKGFKLPSYIYNVGKDIEKITYNGKILHIKDDE